MQNSMKIVENNDSRLVNKKIFAETQKSKKTFDEFWYDFEFGAVQRIANLVVLEKC